MTDYTVNTSNIRKAIDIGYVGNLLSSVYRTEIPTYLPWFFDYKKKSNPFPGVEIEEELEYENAPVRFGQKTFGAFWLKGGRYLNYDYKSELNEVEYSDLLMPLATMVDFSRDKVVTKTPTVGGVGSVKEIYGLDDWNISISGIILPDTLNPYTQQTVSEQMDILQRYHEIAGSIEVEGQLFAQRNITRIVTESLSFSPIQGRPNMMQYSIQAVSDEDLLLTDII